MIPWYAPVARAVPAVVLALVVSFSQDHSTPFGFIVFGAFGVAAGAVITAVSLRADAGTARTVQLLQGVITVVAGVIALTMVNAGLPFFLFVVTTFAAVTGFLELYLGLRGRGKDRSARDRIFIGSLTALLAVAVLLVPPNFVQPYVVSDVTYQLTAPIVVVGLLGLYWAIFGVFLVIAGLSLKWAPEPEPEIEVAEVKA